MGGQTDRWAGGRRGMEGGRESGEFEMGEKGNGGIRQKGYCKQIKTMVWR